MGNSNFGIKRTIPRDVAAALLLLSREKLCAEDDAHARTLLNDLSDSDLLLRLAFEKFSLPFVDAHLSRLKPKWYQPEKVRDLLQQLTFKSLLVAGAQVKFHQTCIEPLKVRHTYVKGITLATQCYEDIGKRFARDIDIIVDRHQIAEVVTLAQDNGYALVDDLRSGAILSTAEQTDAALRYARVANLVSPEGVLIEVHDEVDKDQGIFNEAKMIWQSIPVTVRSVSMNTLPHSLHFVFVAYHSARHSWSSLHWLADIDALVSSPAFDFIEVSEIAETMGLLPMVKATIEFAERSKKFTGELDPEDKVDAIMNLCVLNLEGGLEIEAKIRGFHTRYALPFDWMITSTLRRKILLYRLKGRFRTTYSDYAAFPLPPALRWIYLLTGPASRIVGKLRR